VALLVVITEHGGWPCRHPDSDRGGWRADDVCHLGSLGRVGTRSAWATNPSPRSLGLRARLTPTGHLRCRPPRPRLHKNVTGRAIVQAENPGRAERFIAFGQTSKPWSRGFLPLHDRS